MAEDSERNGRIDDRGATLGSLDTDRRTALKGLGAAGLGVALGGLASGTAAAGDSDPADKIMVDASTVDKLETRQTKNGSTNNGPLELLSGEIKLSTPTDVLIYVSLETSLFTKVKEKGNKDGDASKAKAGMKGWIEIDGTPIPVSASDGLDGDLDDHDKVVFNRRDYSLKYYDLDDDETAIESFIKTRSAHGFNWYAFNVDENFGNTTHTVSLQGQVELEVEDDGEAAALVGPRTMFVQPVKMPNDATY